MLNWLFLFKFFLLHNVGLSKKTSWYLLANINMKSFLQSWQPLCIWYGSFYWPQNSTLSILGTHTNLWLLFSITSLNQVASRSTSGPLPLAAPCLQLPSFLSASCLGTRLPYCWLRDRTQEAMKTTTHIMCKYSLLTLWYSFFNWFTSSVISKWMIFCFMNRKEKSGGLPKVSRWKSAVKKTVSWE